ncbi:hypothetical protein M728_005201 (plasmid) [Ensifer sp. WSM1721]
MLCKIIGSASNACAVFFTSALMRISSIGPGVGTTMPGGATFVKRIR